MKQHESFVLLLGNWYLDMIPFMLGPWIALRIQHFFTLRYPGFLVIGYWYAEFKVLQIPQHVLNCYIKRRIQRSKPGILATTPRIRPNIRVQNIPKLFHPHLMYASVSKEQVQTRWRYFVSFLSTTWLRGEGVHSRGSPALRLLGTSSLRLHRNEDTLTIWLWRCWISFKEIFIRL